MSWSPTKSDGALAFDIRSQVARDAKIRYHRSPVTRNAVITWKVRRCVRAPSRSSDAHLLVIGKALIVRLSLEAVNGYHQERTTIWHRIFAAAAIESINCIIGRVIPVGSGLAMAYADMANDHSNRRIAVYYLAWGWNTCNCRSYSYSVGTVYRLSPYGGPSAPGNGWVWECKQETWYISVDNGVS